MSVRAKVGTAGSWDELHSLVQSAGAAVERAIGTLPNSSQGPDGSSFEENLVVRGIGERPLHFQFFTPSDLDVTGCDFTEEPVLLPPFLCTEHLLQPSYVHVPAKSEGNEATEQYPQPLDRLDVSMESRERSPQSPNSPSDQESDTPSCQLLSSPVHQVRKRKRLEESSSDSDIIDLTQD